MADKDTDLQFSFFDRFVPHYFDRFVPHYDDRRVEFVVTRLVRPRTFGLLLRREGIGLTLRVPGV